MTQSAQGEDESSEVQQSPITLPDGSEIAQNGPVVIIGPNGSGKSRRARQITSPAAIELVSALRNTRISPKLQAMSLQDAKSNYVSQRETAKSQPYELTNDFDFMLTSLIGDALQGSLEYVRLARTGKFDDLPPLSALEKIQNFWGSLFPGRELRFNDYTPTVINSVAVGDEPTEYSAWAMSDGEKAALYLAGRTLGADQGIVIIVDEPETHFHSLLAVRFWDLIERERPDIRFVYATHDMTFAASRGAGTYLLANPQHGLTPIELSSDASDLAAILLGTASLSFYATKVVFCEGEPDSLDSQLYDAWFNDKETVVQCVGSCDMVFRSVSALASSKLVQNLTVRGIIDRDFHSDSRLAGLQAGVDALSVHEIESLFALPDVVAAVAKHLGTAFDKAKYEKSVIAKYVDEDRHRVVIERWKVRVERELGNVVSAVSTKNDTLANITASIPAIFDEKNWTFSPKDVLVEEKDRVENLFTASPPDVLEILKIMPGKQVRGVAPGSVGMKPDNYDQLIIKAIRGDDPALAQLGEDLRKALKPFIPSTA